MSSVVKAIKKAVNDIVDIHVMIINTQLDFIDGILDSIFGSTETLVDIQATNLLTPGEADDRARKAAIRRSGGNLVAYSTEYKAFQRDYRNKYSAKFIKNLGYLPTDTATARTLDSVAVYDYVLTKDPLMVSILRSIAKYMTAEDAAYDWMEDNIGWSNINQIAIDNGRTWVDLVVSEDSTTIYMDFIQEPTENIVEDLTTNYAYDDVANTVTIATELYDVPAFDTTNLGGYYKTTVSRQSDGLLYDIDTNITTAQWTLPISIILNEKLFITYDRGAAEYYYYTEDVNTIPETLYTLLDIDITAIIPMKEDNVIFDENRSMTRMLDKLNLTRGALLSSLENPDMDSAYLMTALWPNVQTDGGMRAVYEMFDLMYEGDGEVSISMSKLNMSYGFTIAKVVINGTVLPTRDYSNTNVGTGTNTVKTIIFQDTATQYHKITISNYVQTYTISGETAQTTLSAGAEISRMVLPIQVLNGLPYRDFVEAYEDSLLFLSFATAVVETSWEESAAFSIVMKIAAIVILVVSILNIWNGGGGGAGFNMAYALWTGGYFLAATVMFVVTVAAVIGFWNIILIAAFYVMVEVFDVDPLIAGAVLAVATWGVGSLTTLHFGAEQWLSLANMTMDQQNQAIITDIEEVQKEDANYAEYAEEQHSELVTLISNMNDGTSVVMLNDMGQYRVPTPYDDAENFVLKQTAYMNWSSLYNVDWAISSRITTEYANN